ncbi:hypothetical protein TNCV_1218091 [Trichonephila clavipes]|nr:hypothetical protein TNCV_1218091 [Trichonephila clavipes]
MRNGFEEVNATRYICVAVAVVAEWLRRWTRNPLGSPRVGSNPTGCGVFFFLETNYKKSKIEKGTEKHITRICIATHDRKRLRSDLDGIVHKSIGGNRPALPQSLELSSPAKE